MQIKFQWVVFFFNCYLMCLGVFYARTGKRDVLLYSTEYTMFSINFILALWKPIPLLKYIRLVLILDNLFLCVYFAKQLVFGWFVSQTSTCMEEKMFCAFPLTTQTKNIIGVQDQTHDHSRVILFVSSLN